MIEKSRYTGLKPEEKLCTFLPNLVEDEIHFVLSCPLFAEERKKVLEKIYRRYPNTALLNNKNMFVWLMCQEDCETTKLLGNFCKKSFNKRTKYFNNSLT